MDSITTYGTIVSSYIAASTPATTTATAAPLIATPKIQPIATPQIQPIGTTIQPIQKPKQQVAPKPAETQPKQSQPQAAVSDAQPQRKPRNDRPKKATTN